MTPSTSLTLGAINLHASHLSFTPNSTNAVQISTHPIPLSPPTQPRRRPCAKTRRNQSDGELGCDVPALEKSGPGHHGGLVRRPRPLRQGAPLVPVPAPLFSAVRLHSGGPVVRSSQIPSPRFPAPSILDQALAARSRRPALYSGDRCFYYLCCVLALYMYALCLWF
ncbi:hypothetical protein MUK42_37320 [Musa troglodytarum]|uniref:Uncharacterized protein n=1 Tax=Musa troglodytarum TaxID=320322 RepID=A0A9E7KQ25_9LILI|nr:hypothetical protein MUK42_37320 [Musa troglodytarum]